jgi:hypothetical protein
MKKEKHIRTVKEEIYKSPSKKKNLNPKKPNKENIESDVIEPVRFNLYQHSLRY